MRIIYAHSPAVNPHLPQQLDSRAPAPNMLCPLIDTTSQPSRASFSLLYVDSLSLRNNQSAFNPTNKPCDGAGWRKLKPGIGTEAWFCDPQAPWQKGSVENLNKRARRYQPRDTPVAALTNRDMKSICDRLNGTPRKCLGWRTPPEAFAEELRKLG
jgi:hypothetical protein